MNTRSKEKVLSKYPVFEQYLMDNEISEFKTIADFALALDIERDVAWFLIKKIEAPLLELPLVMSFGDIINLSFWLNNDDAEFKNDTKATYIDMLVKLLRSQHSVCEIADMIIDELNISQVYTYAENDNQDVFIYVPINNEDGKDVMGYSIKDVLDCANDIWGEIEE